MKRARGNVELPRVAEDELQRRRSANADWLAIARPHLEWLTTTFAHIRHVVYLTDPDGVVLQSVGSKDFIEAVGLSPGHEWSEAKMGTNGAGTALVTDQPVAVVGAEHFVSSFHDCTCTAAPIRAPDGTLVGAIDISTSVADGSPERLCIVAHAADAIGRELAYERQEEILMRVEERLRGRNERLRLLSEAAEMLLQAGDPKAMLPSLFAMIGPHFGLDTYVHFTVDDQGNALCLASCAGVPDEMAPHLDRLEFGDAICGTVALQRKPIVATGIQQLDDTKAELVKSWGIRAYACNPLMAGDELLGTLSFGSRSRDEFTTEELDFLRTVSYYLTAAYERVRFIQQLQEADRRKDEFLAMLAHELRNPLAPIRSGLDILSMEEGNRHRNDIELMQEQVEHLVRLVDDLLDVSRMMQGKVELRGETVELSELVGRSINGIRATIESHQQELHVSVMEKPVWLHADPVRLVQVIDNLLTNASKYTPAGGQLELTAECQDGEAVIRVRDTGVGIQPELLPRIFDLFTQSTRSLDRAEGGLGIGLTLVQRLVEMHEGTVTAESEGIGQGSTFIVRLPTVEAPPHAEEVVEQRPSVRSRRVLIVDDRLATAQMFAALLSKLGDHDVHTAHDGPSALAKTQQIRPEVVLLDIGLPGMDGYQVAKEIRRNPQLDDLLLVALTGYGQEEDYRKSQEAGFDEHLVKPPSADQINAVLAHPKFQNKRRQEQAPARPRQGRSASAQQGQTQNHDRSFGDNGSSNSQIPSLNQLKHDLGNTAYVLKIVVQLLCESNGNADVLEKVKEGLDQELGNLDHLLKILQRMSDR